MITVVTGKEIEKIKGDFESYLNGLNMVGEISYSQYSKLYDEGTKQIQKAYELGKSELEAGRPKWHKVAEGDLPKEQKEYWCKVFYHESEDTFNAFLWFDPRTKDFKFLEDIEDHVESSFNVKTWCEIPKFEKE